MMKRKEFELDEEEIQPQPKKRKVPRPFHEVAANHVGSDRDAVASLGHLDNLAMHVERILLHLGVSDLLNLMMLNKAMYRVLAHTFSEFLKRRTGLNGLAPSTYVGIARIMSRHVPDQDWNEENDGLVEAVMPEREGELDEFVRALGWRDYSSPLRAPRGSKDKNVGFERFGKQVARHYGQSMALRNFAERLPHEAYPKGRYVLSSTGVTLSEQHQEFISKVSEHWSNSFGNIKQNSPRSEDIFARILSDIFNLRSKGQNISVVATSDSRKFLVFVNVNLDEEIKNSIENKVELKKAINNSGKNFFGLFGIPAAKMKSGSVVFEVQYFNSEHLKHGIGRHGSYSLPFHSEMQRTDHQYPWEMHYSGNDYCACPQCAAGYHAMGLDSGSYLGGTHGNKASSVIPPRIRENTVYLRHYLGRLAFQTFKSLSTEDKFAFLDQLERINGPSFNKIKPMKRLSLKWKA